MCMHGILTILFCPMNRKLATLCTLMVTSSVNKQMRGITLDSPWTCLCWRQGLRWTCQLGVEYLANWSVDDMRRRGRTISYSRRRGHEHVPWTCIHRLTNNAAYSALLYRFIWTNNACHSQNVNKNNPVFLQGSIWRLILCLRLLYWHIYSSDNLRTVLSKTCTNWLLSRSYTCMSVMLHADVNGSKTVFNKVSKAFSYNCINCTAGANISWWCEHLWLFIAKVIDLVVHTPRICATIVWSDPTNNHRSVLWYDGRMIRQIIDGRDMIDGRIDRHRWSRHRWPRHRWSRHRWSTHRWPTPMVDTSMTDTDGRHIHDRHRWSTHPWPTPMVDTSMTDTDGRHIHDRHRWSTHPWPTPTVDTSMTDTDDRHTDDRHRWSTHRWPTPMIDFFFTDAIVMIGDPLLGSILFTLALHIQGSI